jgi:hypothetical protein
MERASLRAWDAASKAFIQRGASPMAKAHPGRACPERTSAPGLALASSIEIERASVPGGCAVSLFFPFFSYLFLLNKY